MQDILDYIKFFDFDKEIGKEIIAQYGESPNWKTHTWYSSATKESHSNEEKELDNFFMSDNDVYAEILKSYSYLAIKKYCQMFPRLLVTDMSTPRLNRYNTGTIMREHVDHIHTIFDGQRKGIPSITILGGLNDDYEGGEFSICGRDVPLKAGQIVIFPSNYIYPHGVKEVTSGTRYSFVSWSW